MIKKLVIIVCWVSVIALGAFLRLDQLAKRPFHCDEATGARITAKRMDLGGCQFDPTHFHGPLLSSLAIPLCRAQGETRWQDLTKATLRRVPVLCGLLLVMLPLCWRRRWGDVPMLLAAALLATSPLLVYYSRMFIHESLLGLCGVLALMAVLTKPKFGIPGVFIGLMYATKESFAISMVAWLGAGGLVILGKRGVLTRDALAGACKTHGLSVVLSAFTALLVAEYFYTDGFQHAQGMVDAVRTFFVYKTVDGHDKPFFYYLDLFAMPKKAGGIWWFGTPVVGLAVLAYVSTYFRGASINDRRVDIIRFIAYAAVGHVFIYSLMAYKTPWLMLLPWAHVCLLAGFCLTDIANRKLQWKVAMGLLVALTLVSQFRQARFANGRLASDPRNPFAYVPTRRDVENIEPWLQQLAKFAPEHSLGPLAVIGSGYWPLPWYLRSFESIGYWPEPQAGLEKFTIVFAMPESSEAVMAKLSATHTALPRGLRADFSVTLLVRNDIWNAWNKADHP